MALRGQCAASITDDTPGSRAVVSYPTCSMLKGKSPAFTQEVNSSSPSMGNASEIRFRDKGHLACQPPVHHVIVSTSPLNAKRPGHVRLNTIIHINCQKMADPSTLQNAIATPTGWLLLQYISDLSQWAHLDLNQGPPACEAAPGGFGKLAKTVNYLT